MGWGSGVLEGFENSLCDKRILAVRRRNLCVCVCARARRARARV